MESTPIRIPASSGSVNANAPWSNGYSATVQPPHSPASNNNCRLGPACWTASFFIYSGATIATLFGVSIAQLVVKLQTKEKSEMLEKVITYTLYTYLVVALAFVFYISSNTSSRGSGSYRGGSSSYTDYSYDGIDTSHSSHDHHYDSGGHCGGHVDFS